MGVVKAATWSPSPAVAERMSNFRPVFDQVAGESGIMAEVLMAVAIVESRLDPVAENPASGAKGLMQIMPLHYGTRRDLPHGPDVTIDSANWTHPLVNVRYGAAILVDYGALEEETGWWEVLNRYNGDRPPRDPEYEDDVQSIHAALMRRELIGF